MEVHNEQYAGSLNKASITNENHWKMQQQVLDAVSK